MAQCLHLSPTGSISREETSQKQPCVSIFNFLVQGLTPARHRFSESKQVGPLSELDLEPVAS